MSKTVSYEYKDLRCLKAKRDFYFRCNKLHNRDLFIHHLILCIMSSFPESNSSTAGAETSSSTEPQPSTSQDPNNDDPKPGEEISKSPKY